MLMSTNRALLFTETPLTILKVKSKFVYSLKYWPLTAHISIMMPVISANKICHPKTSQMTFLNKEPPELQFSKKLDLKPAGHYNATIIPANTSTNLKTPKNKILSQ